MLLPLGCGAPSSPWAGQPGPPRVVVTFAPLHCFVKNVAGDDVGLLPLATTSGPHLYEPTVDEALKLRQADLFFVNGLELDERFADRLARTSANKKLQGQGGGYVMIGERLRAKGLVDKMAEHAGHAHHHHGPGHEGHHHGEYDPHVWLGVPQAIGIVEVIRDELKRIHPDGAAGYDSRAAAYVAELKELHEYGRAALAAKKERSLVTNHDSLHYFAKTFGLTVAGVVQIQAGTDADSATLAELIKTCKEKDVRVIAAEPQFQQRGAATALVKELRGRGLTDAALIEIDPLETVTPGETLDRGWYVRRMKVNIDTLAGTLR